MERNNNYVLEGYLYKKFPTKEFPPKKEGEKGFKKKEFVIEVKEYGGDGREYKDFVKFESTGSLIDLIDQLGLASKVNVGFSLGGREWKKDGESEPIIINYHRAFKISVVENTNQDAPKQMETTPGFGGRVDEEASGLPF